MTVESIVFLTMTTSVSSANAAASAHIITQVACNDVLLGRGTGPSSWEGNQKFRKHVDARRRDYTSCHTVNDKTRIAQEVVNHIHEQGGRFLRQIRKGRKVGNVLVGGTWQRVAGPIVIEKAKQALREKIPQKEGQKQAPIDRTPNEDRAQVTTTRVEVAQASLESMTPVVTPQPHESRESHQDPVSPPPLSLLSSHPLLMTGAGLNSLPVPMLQYPLVNPLLFLFQNGLASLQPPTQPIMSASGHSLHQFGQRKLLAFPNIRGMVPQGLIPDANPQVAPASFNQGFRPAESIPTGIRRPPSHKRPLPEETKNEDDEANDDLELNNSSELSMSSFSSFMSEASKENEAAAFVLSSKSIMSSMSSTSSSMSEASKEEEAATSVLSFLANKDRPVITDEQVKQEKAALSDQQWASVLADLFGKMNTGSDAAPSSKKQKRDLDRESIDFLLLRMRFEIEKIPESKKQALIEARAKCRAEEFSDARLEKFLRCEGMNAELAAQRFVGYWEKRKEAFGKDKFTLRLTLSEALRDDIAALDVAVYSLLPRRDLSGRQIMYLVPPHNTEEGYSPDSLFRAIWYVAEVAAAQNTDVRSGVVEVTWLKDFSLWDYDPKIYDRLITYNQCYLPVRTIAAHVCCPPRVFVRWLFPIFNALVDRFMRSRVQVHDVSENEIVDALSEYGISREMLPTEMGGTVELNPTEWIAQRRAAEMEEL